MSQKHHVEGDRGYQGPALRFSYDGDRDVMTIEGQEYSGQLLREMGKDGAPNGSLLEILRGKDGLIAVKRIYTPGERERG